MLILAPGLALAEEPGVATGLVPSEEWAWDLSVSLGVAPLKTGGLADLGGSFPAAIGLGFAWVPHRNGLYADFLLSGGGTASQAVRDVYGGESLAMAHFLFGVGFRHRIPLESGRALNVDLGAGSMQSVLMRSGQPVEQSARAMVFTRVQLMFASARVPIPFPFQAMGGSVSLYGAFAPSGSIGSFSAAGGVVGFLISGHVLGW